MYIIIAAIAHTTTVVTAVIIMAVRIEHRITKIETDISWLKAVMLRTNCKGNKNGKDDRKS